MDRQRHYVYMCKCQVFGKWNRRATYESHLCYSRRATYQRHLCHLEELSTKSPVSPRRATYKSHLCRLGELPIKVTCAIQSRDAVIKATTESAGANRTVTSRRQVLGDSADLEED